MAISKKLPSYERQVNDLINKGGAVANTNKKEERTIQNIQLRLPNSLIKKIDSQCTNDDYKIKKSRHSWILDAILEKIDRENV
ncbi:protein of unknown function (plasmid) [Cardinium endosymbiont cEper1 of Encarsia pergandiella]|uniref:hypothetical protein n=1 Tax=Cardinium endosymbiont of Encarsia pergandiella TaxID=249402 RepID=UPI00027E9E28|nr:hypothetical protein [Cardinium endosymbiont of Encarsia pergandiella]CCM10660.1 protein of unknown function [Cardinium endosymbiont cEper1 of Encarsia pergandiella]